MTSFTFGFPSSAPSNPAPSFGATPTTGTFGAPSSGLTSMPGAASAPTLFGTSTPSTSFGTLFSNPSTSSSTSLFPSSTPSSSTPFLQPSSSLQPASSWSSLSTTSVKPPPVAPQQRIQAIMDSYNRDSNECRFRYMMYNRVDPSEVDKYARPLDVNERLWLQAVEANPDPSKLVPVQAVGFTDLKQRIAEQDKATEAQQKALQDLRKVLDDIQHKHSLETTIKLEQYKQRHTELSHRVLKVMRKLEVLRCKGYGIIMEEEAFRTKLENLQRELNQPNQYKGRLNELSSYLRMQEERPAERYDALDEDNLEVIYDFLEQQRSALNHLVGTLKTVERDLQIISENMPTTTEPMM